MHTHVDVYLHAYAPAYINAYMQERVHLHIHTNMDAYTYTQTHTGTHSGTHSRTQTHTTTLRHSTDNVICKQLFERWIVIENLDSYWGSWVIRIDCGLFTRAKRYFRISWKSTRRLTFFKELAVDSAPDISIYINSRGTSSR